VLIDEKDIMLEAGIEVRFKTKLPDYWVVMAIDMGVHSVHSLENLPNHAGEGFRKLDANSTWEYSFIVNVALNPGHQMFNVRGSRHLCGTFVVLSVLPEVLELICRLHLGA